MNKMNKILQNLNAQVYDITPAHGAQTVSESLRLFDQGLESGDQIVCHRNYKLRFNKQTRAEFYREAQAIQSYVCDINPNRRFRRELESRVANISENDASLLLDYLDA